jgi:hypothetical protein
LLATRVNTKRMLAAVSIAVLLLPCGTTAPAPQGPGAPLRYRAVMTPPWRSKGWDRAKPYEDMEGLTVVLNLLDSEGYDAMLLEPIIDDFRVEKGEYRFLITARRR